MMTKQEAQAKVDKIDHDCSEDSIAAIEHAANAYRDLCQRLIEQMPEASVEPVMWRVKKWPQGMSAIEKVQASQYAHTRADLQRYEAAGAVMEPLYTSPRSQEPSRG